MRRTLSVGGFATLVAVIGAGAAIAGSTPRLQGKFRVRVTVMAAKNIGQRKGATGVVRWNFAPTCATGACPTRFTRRTLDRTTAHDVIKPNGARYRDILTSTLECVHKTTVLVKKGYHAKLTIIVRPTKTNSGAVAAFSGTGLIVDTPTASGRSHNCGAASERFRFHSL